MIGLVVPVGPPMVGDTSAITNDGQQFWTLPDCPFRGRLQTDALPG